MALVMNQSAALSSDTQHAMPTEFDRKRIPDVVPVIPLLTLLYAIYSVKLKKIYTTKIFQNDHHTLISQ